MSAPFTIEAPTALGDALELLAQGDETVRVVGGGTGLTILMKYGFFEPTKLINLGRLPAEYARIEAAENGDLHIGALATLRAVERASDVAQHAPVLVQTMARLSTVRVRNVARVGGAIAHGHPQMDLPPVLIALGARVKVESIHGSRWIDAEDLFLGYYETAIRDDEIVTAVMVPARPSTRARYRKVTARTQDDWPLLGLAASATTENGTVTGLRAAIGGITDSATLLPDVASQLVGSAPTRDRLDEVAQDVAGTLDFHDNGNGSARYQRHLVGVHLRLLLEDVLLNSNGKGRA